MGKISPPSIKYVIKVKFETEGVVEKPDVIGAVFGQTEGLLGDDMELRDLQKKGKIGRIDAEMDVLDSKTKGYIEIPTSLDKTSTTIIAAAIETIDRVGPCDAKFTIEDVSDVRTNKREYILERAKKLMEKLSSSQPEMRAMEQEVNDSAKKAKIQKFGDDDLFSGPDMDSKEIIVVEGRADVLNLLRCGINNVVSMNGAMLPKSIKELSLEKELTIFVDGDRGGLLIVKDALTTARIKYIARAPDGKEVEELTDKEINMALRNKKSIGDFEREYLKDSRNGKSYTNNTSSPSRSNTMSNSNSYPAKETPKSVVKEKVELSDDEIGELADKLNALKSAKTALLITKTDQGLEIFKKIPATDIGKLLRSYSQRIVAIVTNATVTKTIINLAEDYGIDYIAGKSFSATSNKVKMLSF